MRTEIIYEDNYIIVCYKPAGLATQTAKVGQPDVVSELKNYLNAKNKAASDSYVGIVHRLDQPVEGLLVFAKTKKAAAGLSAQLTQGILNKRYYAVVCGQPAQTEAELVDYLAKTADNKAVAADKAKLGEGAAVAEKEAALSGLKFQKAVLHYRWVETLAPLEQKEPEIICLVDISIDTGRFHQIRAQMSCAGMPLLGDTKYGNDTSVSISKQLSVLNVALCAYELEFKHPVTGRVQHFERNPEGAVFEMFNYFKF